MSDARTIILCPTPLGPGNIALIEAALAARKEGHEVVILEPTATVSADAASVLALVGACDYSGQGESLYRQLLSLGCPIVSSAAEALSLITSLTSE
jgi:iron complex transport system ATP-binding protein